VPLTYLVFGMHMHYHLAFIAALSVFAAAMFYGVLRTLGVPWVHATLIAALTIVFPWSDSTRLWATAGLVTLSVCFAFAGVLIALQGLRRHAWRWHAFAVLLYLLSILTYELTLPFIACVGVLYWVRAGWQAAKWRWLADLMAIVGAGIWVWANTAKTTSGVAGDVSHAKEIVIGGGRVLGRAGYPLGSPETMLVLIAMAAVLGSGLCAHFVFADRFVARGSWNLQNWLGLTIGGLALAILGWVLLVPAEPYYTPSIFGEVNRINGLAAFGLVLAVYGSLGILCALACQVISRNRILATTMTLLLGTTLFVAYAHVLRRHIHIWNTAYAAEIVAIDETKHRFPHLPPGSTVIASSYPASQAPGVPILANTWDYDGMIKMEYDDSSLSAYPLLKGFQLACRANGVVLERKGMPEASAAYGTARFLDLSTGMRSVPRSRSECMREVGAYVPGPMYLSDSY
jgi:hypothetical protein